MPSAIDKATSKWLDTYGLLKWLSGHYIDVMRYLESRYKERSDRAYNMAKFVKDPYLGYILVQDTLYSNEEKIAKIVDFVSSSSFVCPVVGRKGGGKTATVLWFFEILHKLKPKLKLYWMDINPNLPKYIKIVSDWDEVEDNSVVCAEEAAVKYFSRDAMTRESKDLGKMLFISRHRGLRIFFNYQTLTSADVNIHRLSDAFLIKPFQMIELADLTENKRARRFFQYVSMMSPTTPEQTLFTMGDEWIKFDTPLPSFWSEDISKSYKKTDLHSISYEVELMSQTGMNAKQIVKRLKPRGVNMTESEVRAIIRDPENYRKIIRELEDD